MRKLLSNKMENSIMKRRKKAKGKRKIKERKDSDLICIWLSPDIKVQKPKAAVMVEVLAPESISFVTRIKFLWGPWDFCFLIYKIKVVDKMIYKLSFWVMTWLYIIVKGMAFILCALNCQTPTVPLQYWDAGKPKMLSWHKYAYVHGYSSIPHAISFINKISRP